jgi:hypothetical protein
MAEADIARSIITAGDVRPIPDPTILTSSLVEAAKQELRRELDGVSQMGAMRDDMAMRAIDDTRDQLRREGAAVRAIVEARLDGSDKAIVLLQTTQDRIPGHMNERVSTLQAYIEQKLNTVAEQFHSIQTQFIALDTRIEQNSNSAKEAIATALQAQKEAIAAALQAAKELVAAQNIASTNAILKSETSTDKRIDETQRQLSAMQAALDGRIGLISESVKTMMPREEVLQLFRTVTDKVDGPTGLAQRFEGLAARTATRDEQSQRGTQSNQWLIGAVLGGMGLLLALLAFMKG